MIEIAQKARQAELVKALHGQCRMLLCPPVGVAPGDKEWHKTHERFVTKIDTIKTEAQIPQLTMLIFMVLETHEEQNADVELHCTGGAEAVQDVYGESSIFVEKRSQKSGPKFMQAMRAF